MAISDKSIEVGAEGHKNAKEDSKKDGDSLDKTNASQEEYFDPLKLTFDEYLSNYINDLRSKAKEKQEKLAEEADQKEDSNSPDKVRNRRATL